MAPPQRFRIHIPQTELDQLQSRLRHTRWPVEVGNADGRYGAPKEWVADLVRYWTDTYDWRATEAAMNAYEHYRVVIDDVPIHFMRVPGERIRPLAARADSRLALDLLGSAPSRRRPRRPRRVWRRPY